VVGRAGRVDTQEKPCVGRHRHVFTSLASPKASYLGFECQQAAGAKDPTIPDFSSAIFFFALVLWVQVLLFLGGNCQG
jgi:hypothetical protein